MFKNLLGFWSGKGFLEEVLEEFAEMIKTAEKMYGLVIKDFFEPNLDKQFTQSIYDMDQKINNHERHIRKRIVEHLSIHPSKGMNVSLILMSVVKDAERVGDLTKNLLEAGRKLKRPLEKDEFVTYINDLFEKIATYFSATLKTFIEFDEEHALRLIKDARTSAKDCERLITQLAASNLDANRVVCFTITARFLKRIASHLVNIATAVVVPVSDLDYFDERRMSDI